MTIEKAIETLGMLRIFDAPALSEAVKMAVAALRAQQEPAKLDRSRWGKCPDCKREWGVCAIPTNRFEMREQRFCGSCGRPLTDEAWAELERRIGG